MLEEDERGNVYIVDIVPGGNASRKKTINVSVLSVSLAPVGSSYLLD